MTPNKLFWEWGYDGTVVRVKYAYYTSFLKRLKTKTVAMFFTRDFTDAVAVAEDYIERTQYKYEQD